MRTGEKRIHYLKIIRQLSTYKKRKCLKKEERRVNDISSAATFPLWVYLTIYSYALSGNVAPQWQECIVFKKSAFFLKHLMHMRWLQHKTVQSNMAAPFISKQKMHTHFAMWRIRCQSRSIDITYKYKNSTITKTITMRHEKTVNSALTLSNDCWQTAGNLLNYEIATSLQK